MNNQSIDCSYFFQVHEKEIYTYYLGIELQTKTFWDLHTTPEPVVGSSKSQGQNSNSPGEVVEMVCALWLKATSLS